MKYKSTQNLVSIRHQTDAPRHHMFIRQNHVYTHQFENASKCIIEGDKVSASTSPRPSGLSELPVAHMCVTMRMRILRQVSRATSFEMGLLRKVLSGMGVPVLCPRPCVRGWIMHLLFNIEYEWYGMDTGGPMPRYILYGYMFGMSRRYEQQVDPFDGMTERATLTDDTPWLGMMSRHMGHVSWEPRWCWMRHCIQRPWPRSKARTSRMTWA